MYLGKIFPGTPEDVAMWHPWIDESPLCNEGTPLGIYARSRVPMLFDPWIMRDQKSTHSTSYMVIGQKDMGKSSLIKSIVLQLLGRNAQIIDGERTKMRATIDDRKHEEGIGEYEPLTNFLEGKVVKLANASLNIFDPHMELDELDMVETAVNICEYANEGERPLTLPQIEAIQVAVNKMHREYSEIASQHTLHHLLASITEQDWNNYYSYHHDKFKNMYQEQLMDLPELRPLRANESTIRQSEFLDGAGDASRALNRLMRGDFGQSFSGNDSLYEALKEPVADFDWVGVQMKARVVIESLIWKYRDRAQENYQLAIIPHISAGDEEADAYESLMYLRFRAASVRKERQSPQFSIKSAQYLSQLTKAGDKDSEKRELAKTINNGIAGYFIGPTPLSGEKDPDSIKHDIAGIGLSEEDVEYVTQMPVGTFGLKLPNKNVRFFHCLLTDTELELVETNAAVKSMMQFA